MDAIRCMPLNQILVSFWETKSIQEINVDGVKVLSRTENFANYHEQLGQLLRKGLLISALGQLAGEDMVLFKEKINYKFSGSGTLSERDHYRIPGA